MDAVALVAALTLAATGGAALVDRPPPSRPSGSPGSGADQAARAGVGDGPASATGAPGTGRPRWRWPVGGGSPPPLVAPFDAPETRWGPGHRGLDLGTRTGAEVRAVADGRVTHRGRVAGRPTLSITHDDGIRSTYEPVDSTLRVGERVRRGQVVGRIGDEAGHCAPRACLHVGALRGRDYLDPLPFFGAGRVVLLPVP